MSKRHELRALMASCEVSVFSGAASSESPGGASFRIQHATLRKLAALPTWLIVNLFPGEPASAPDDDPLLNHKFVFTALRITSTALSPSAIGDLLAAEFQPPLASLAPLAPLKGSETVCLLDSGVGVHAPIEAHFGAMTRMIYRQRQALRRLAHDCRLELVCNFAANNGQGGPYIHKTRLRYLASVPVDFIFQLFKPETVGPVAPR